MKNILSDQFVYSSFWGMNTEHKLPNESKRNGFEYVLVGWGNGGYRAQLLSMWMTKLSPSASEYDTFTYNAPGVYVKIQDE